MLLLLLFTIKSFTSYANDIDAAGLIYNDEFIRQKSAHISATGNFQMSDDVSTSLSLDAFGRETLQKDEALDIVKSQYEGDPTLKQTFLSASPNVTFGKNNAGVNYGMMKSRLDATRIYGLQLSRWWLEDSFQTTLSYSKSKTTKSSLVRVYDRTARIIVLPEEVSGTSTSLKFTHLATTSTIIIASVGQSLKEDRPQALTGSAEVRQFISALSASVFVGVEKFREVGGIKNNTNYGPVASQGMSFAWNQTLPTEEKHIILSYAGRRYFEVEKDSDYFLASTFQSSLNSLTVRYRFGDGPWTAERPEAYLIVGDYRTDEKRRGVAYGAGGTVVF